jgi:hypothetical protein
MFFVLGGCTMSGLKEEFDDIKGGNRCSDFSFLCSVL